MKSKRLLSVITVGLLAGSSLGIAVQAAPAPQTGQSSVYAAHVPGKLVVKFHAGVQAAAQKQLLAEVGATEESVIAKLNVHVLHISKDSALEHVIQALSKHAEVQYAEPVYYRHATFTPNDSSYSQEWALSKVQAASAWDVFRDASAVTIGIIDTGVDARHPDLVSQLVPGWNYDSTSPNYNTSNTQDDYGHGTHVAGIAAATTNNGAGVASVSFNARIMPVKVLNSTGTGNDQDIANGIVWAADHGAQVLNMSFGDTQYSQMLEDAVNYAYNDNCLVVAAAGNDSTNETFYPAALVNAMAVSATDANDNLASFSNYGNDISVAAPGVNILSTYWASSGSMYATLSGTSMAAPMVSGIAALAYAQDLTRLNVDVRTIIEQNADQVSGAGWNQYTGNGRVDAYNVVTGRLSGTVYDFKTGLALANATVKLVQNGTVVASTTTDGTGTYRFIHLPKGAYDVTVSAAGYQSATQPSVAVTPGYETQNVNVSLN